ncbi:HDOD domain-containing protein [Methyloversatilis thermotolerans]|uniref:HDOD domain-containing protein n=1 Tax=Methyloversatilis thermotolerans TaxID=1346290 RepID=UPI000377680B|nr:HDOD domain-containing protein [Methyloversatilis thermotolerans]
MLTPSLAIERLFATAGQLPSIPRVVQQLIATLKDEDADLHPLIADIKQDPAISAKVLRLANSGFYAGRRTVGSIDEAITLIGTRAMRTLVISAGLTGVFTKVQGVDLKDFWRHALTTASAAAMLAKEARMDAESAYSAGLMHRVGQLMIHIAFPRVAEEIARDCRDLSVAERAAVEQVKLHTNHCEVGAELAVRWNFPDDIVQALKHYSQPQHPDAGKLARIVHLAAQLAFDIEDQVQPENIAEHLNKALTDDCGLDRLALVPAIRDCAANAPLLDMAA